MGILMGVIKWYSILFLLFTMVIAIKVGEKDEDFKSIVAIILLAPIVIYLI